MVSYDKLLASAKQMDCTSAVYTFDANQKRLADAADVGPVIPWKESLQTRSVRKSEQKYYLRNTAWAYLPLTELQAVKLNVAVSTRTPRVDPASYLSDRQKRLMLRILKVLEDNPKALAGLSFPEDQSNLPAYHQQLLAKLQQYEK